MDAVGLILAGGRSRRMGRDKARLDYRGRPLLLHMRDLLSEALGTSGQTRGRVWASGDFQEVPGIPDLRPGLGPLGGLWSAAEYFCSLAPTQRPARILIVPVDMPLLQVETLSLLLNSANPSRHAAQFESWEMPLLLAINDEVRAALAERCLNTESPASERSVRALLSRLNAQKLVLAGGREREFLNANTPEEWDRL